MSQPIWKGHISFGLVSIPVELRPAESRDDLDLDLLDRRDHAPIGYRKFNKNTGKEVPREQIVRGYQYQPGKYVVLTDADLQRASVERTQRIDIRYFCDAAEIAPLYFDRPYYLEADPRNGKPYALLREVLERTGKVGIASVVLRTRQYASALFPMGKILVLDLLRYSEELRDPGEIHAPARGPRSTKSPERELKMAERLVAEMSASWDPDEMHDEYRTELLAFIKRKAGKGEVEEVVQASRRKDEGGRVLDMMSLLKRSLEQPGTSSRKAPRRRRA